MPIPPQMSHGTQRIHGNSAPHPDCRSPPPTSCWLSSSALTIQMVGGGEPTFREGCGVRGFRGFRGHSIGAADATAAQSPRKSRKNLFLVGYGLMSS